MRELDLNEAHADDKGLCLLTGLTALSSLDLSFCHNITDAGLKALVAPLSRHSLSHVDVSECDGLTLLSLVSLQISSGEMGGAVGACGLTIRLEPAANITEANITVRERRQWHSQSVCLCRRTTWAWCAAVWWAY